MLQDENFAARSWLLNSGWWLPGYLVLGNGRVLALADDHVIEIPVLSRGPGWCADDEPVGNRKDRTGEHFLKDSSEHVKRSCLSEKCQVWS